MIGREYAARASCLQEGDDAPDLGLGQIVLILAGQTLPDSDTPTVARPASVGVVLGAGVFAPTRLGHVLLEPIAASRSLTMGLGTAWSEKERDAYVTCIQAKRYTTAKK